MDIAILPIWCDLFRWMRIQPVKHAAIRADRIEELRPILLEIKGVEG